MAIITYPLNNIQYEAGDAETYLSTRTSGIFASKEHFEASIRGNRYIDISSGLAWIKNDDFKGKSVISNETVTVTLDTADADLPRIDRIVLRFDATQNASSIIALKGTPSSVPAPVERSTTPSLYDLVLYDILIPASSVAITASDITDQRDNEELCGLMVDGVTKFKDAISYTVKTTIGTTWETATANTSITNVYCRYYQLIHLNTVKADSNIMYSLASDATLEQRQAAEDARLFVVDQWDRGFVIACAGSKPKISIPIIVTIFA